ncbi:unnamed protein product [Gadus morhua 'NCC']
MLQSLLDLTVNIIWKMILIVVVSGGGGERGLLDPDARSVVHEYGEELIQQQTALLPAVPATGAILISTTQRTMLLHPR